MTNTCNFSLDGDLKKLELVIKSKSPPAPTQVFKQLKEIFTFIGMYLDVHVTETTTLISLLSPHVCTWLCDKLVRHVLAPAVPDTPQELHTYQDTVEQTEELQEYLVNIRLVPSDNLTLLNYARNVDAIFASKLCQNLLAESREIMKRDLFISTKVSPENIESEDDGTEGS